MQSCGFRWLSRTATPNHEPRHDYIQLVCTWVSSGWKAVAMRWLSRTATTKNIQWHAC